MCTSPNPPRAMRFLQRRRFILLGSKKYEYVIEYRLPLCKFRMLRNCIFFCELLLREKEKRKKIGGKFMQFLGRRAKRVCIRNFNLILLLLLPKKDEKIVVVHSISELYILVLAAASFTAAAVEAQGTCI